MAKLRRNFRYHQTYPLDYIKPEREDRIREPHPSFIKQSQAAADRKKKAREQKQVREKEFLAKKKYCCNCGEIYGSDEFPGIGYVEWIRTIYCKNCPVKSRSKEFKYCQSCRTVITRLPGQVGQSWGSLSYCDSCKSG